MAIIKNDWADAWTTNLTTDPAYGAIPPLTVSSGGTVNTISNVTISDGTGFGGYTIGGLNGATGSNAVWTTNTTATGSFTIGPNYSAVGSQLDQTGRMSLRGENADLDINGKSLKDWMDKVEERLNILTPNPELEKEWDELRRLGERYRKLEKKCKEKAEVWKKLKAMPKPEVKW
jgi:hypothetical protein